MSITIAPCELSLQVESMCVLGSSIETRQPFSHFEEQERVKVTGKVLPI